MVLKVIKKINGKLRFLYRKNSFLNAWASENAIVIITIVTLTLPYPNLNAKLKKTANNAK